MWGSSSSILRSSWITKLLTLSRRIRPATRWRNLTSAACMHNFIFFNHFSTLMNIAEGWIAGWLITKKIKNSLFTTMIPLTLNSHSRMRHKNAWIAPLSSGCSKPSCFERGRWLRTWMCWNTSSGPSFWKWELPSLSDNPRALLPRSAHDSPTTPGALGISGQIHGPQIHSRCLASVELSGLKQLSFLRYSLTLTSRRTA